MDACAWATAAALSRSWAACSLADSGRRWPPEDCAERGELDLERAFSSERRLEPEEGRLLEEDLSSADEGIMDAVATEMAESLGLAMAEGKQYCCLMLVARGESMDGDLCGLGPLGEVLCILTLLRRKNRHLGLALCEGIMSQRVLHSAPSLQSTTARLAT